MRTRHEIAALLFVDFGLRFIRAVLPIWRPESSIRRSETLSAATVGGAKSWTVRRAEVSSTARAEPLPPLGPKSGRVRRWSAVILVPQNVLAAALQNGPLVVVKMGEHGVNGGDHGSGDGRVKLELRLANRGDHFKDYLVDDLLLCRVESQLIDQSKLDLNHALIGCVPTGGGSLRNHLAQGAIDRDADEDP